MKSGETPKLDSKWWEKAKAVTLGKTGLADALKLYEAKAHKHDYQGMLDSLEGVRRAVGVAQHKCNKTLHKETLECLNKFPGVIHHEEVRLEHKIEEEAAKQHGAVPKQQVGGPVVIWKKSLGTEFYKEHGKKHPWLKTASGGDFALKINSDIEGVLEEVGESVLLQRMVDAANELFEKGLAQLNQHMASHKYIDEIEMIETLEHQAAALAKALGPKFEAIPANEWNKFVAKHQQYKLYKLKVGFNATIAGLKIVSSGLILATAVPTGGATLALGIVGVVNSCAEVAKQLRDGFQECETVLKRYEKNMVKLKEEFVDTQKQALAKAKEIGATVFDTILNYPTLPTIKTCRNDHDLAENKSAGLNVKAVDLGKKINKALNQVHALEKLLDKADQKVVIKAISKIQGLEKQLSKALDDCADLGKRVHDTEHALEENEKLLKEIEGGAGKYINAFEKIFPTAYNVTLALVNGGLGFAEAKGTLEIVETALTLASDLSIEVKNVLME